jgi:spore coat polysaccharide biosynthesis protein SpsF
MDSYLVIIQARMGSSRLAGKSLVEVGGKAMLEHVIDAALSVFPPRSIYVATTRAEEDQPIVNLCGQLGIKLFRGDVQNVASRYFEILKREPRCQYFFRVCGDTPLYDPELFRIGKRIVEEEDGRCEVVTSLPNKGYPMGQNLELLCARLFGQMYPDIRDSHHLEHVTSYFYEHLDTLTHRLVECDLPGYTYDKYKYSVDTVDDLPRIEHIFRRLSKPHYEHSLAEKCAHYDEAP